MTSRWNNTMLPRYAPWLAAIAAVLYRILVLFVFKESVLFEPLPGSVHDRSLYLLAITQVSGGAFFPNGAFEYLPLYPWVVGLLGSWFGPGLWLAALFGVVCDALTTGLVVRLTQRLGAAPYAALIAGLLYAFYPLAVLYSLLTMPNSLNALGVTALVYLAQRSSPWTWKTSLLLGLLAGATALGFAGMMLIAFAVAVAGWVQGAFRPRAAALLFLLGLAIPLAPVAYHNTRAEGAFVLLTTHGGLNFYMGNHERATGYPLRVENFRMTAKAMLEDAHRHAEAQASRPLKRSESAAWWSGQARAYWREHPWAALKLTARKLMLFWNCREVDDLRMREQLRIAAPAYRLLTGAPFAVFGLLGLYGLVYARGGAVTKTALLAGMAGLVVFFITARYRLTLVPLMAALGMAAATGELPRRKQGRWWVLAAAAAVVFFPFSIRDQRPVDYYNVAIQLLSLDRGGEAARVIDEGLAIAPDSAELHFARGTLLFKQEDFHGAAAALSESLRANPHQPTAWFNLALSLARGGDYCAARDALEEALRRQQPLEPRALELLRELRAAVCP